MNIAYASDPEYATQRQYRLSGDNAPTRPALLTSVLVSDISEHLYKATALSPAGLLASEDIE